MDTSLQTASDGITNVSPNALIALAHSARSLSLDPKQIRSRISDTLQSRFKGRGMEYDESRPYQPGDDVRHLDWRVTARSNKTYTKTFQEERERPVFLWTDHRPSMFFATRGKFKSVIASEISALLGWTAAHRGDRIGGAVFFGDNHHEVKPMRGRLGILRFIHYLSEVPRIESHETELGTPLNRMSRIARPGSMIILISDFRGIDQQAQHSLMKLAAHGELIMIQIYDPIEKELPPPGEYRVTNGAQEIRFSAHDENFRERYQSRFEERTKRVMQISKKLGAIYLCCKTDDKPLAILQRTFGTRRR